MNAENPTATFPEDPPATEHAQATPTRAPARTRPRPRTSPIIWGAIVLAFCLYSAIQLIAPGSIDSLTFFIASLIILGALLLVVAVVVIALGSRRG